MPWPCCCRNENNGLGCSACDLQRTPLQWALTWPEFAIQYQVNGVYTDIFRMPTGTHILSQTPGGGACCWNGAGFRICTNTQGVDWIARPFVWRYSEFATEYLTANWVFEAASVTPVQMCGTLGGNNRVGRVTWSKTTLAGCRAGPYTVAVAAQDKAPMSAAGRCSQSAFLYFTQVAGNVVLDDV